MICQGLIQAWLPYRMQYISNGNDLVIVLQLLCGSFFVPTFTGFATQHEAPSSTQLFQQATPRRATIFVGSW